MITKVCTLCKQELPATIEYFSEDKRLKCWFSSYCKKCKAKQQREREKKYSKERKEERALYKRERSKNNKEKNREHNIRQKEAGHRKAHKLVKRLKLKYWLTFNKCAICWLNGEMVAHHPNYNEPSKVIIVCNNCHQAIHRGVITEYLDKVIDLKEMDSRPGEEKAPKPGSL